MINNKADLNSKPFFVKDKEGKLWAQAALVSDGPYIYTNGMQHIVIEDWDDYASASEDLDIVGTTLAGGMLVRYTNNDVSEALNDITMRLDILRRKMFIPIKVVSRDEFRIIMDTPNGLDYYSEITLNEADGHLGVFREEIDRGTINIGEDGVEMPVHVFGSVMLYSSVLAERLEIINDHKNIITLTPAMNENDLVMLVVYGNDESRVEEETEVDTLEA